MIDVNLWFIDWFKRRINLSSIVLSQEIYESRSINVHICMFSVLVLKFLGVQMF